MKAVHDLSYESRTKPDPRSARIAIAVDALVVLSAVLFVLLAMNVRIIGIGWALPVLYFVWLAGSFALALSLRTGWPERERRWRLAMIAFTVGSVGFHMLIGLFLLAYASI